MPDAAKPEKLPSSRFIRTKLPIADSHFTADDMFEAEVMPMRLNEPDFGIIGWRLMQAFERYKEFEELIVKAVDEWSGYPEVRAPLSTPEEIEIRLRNWGWYELPHSRRLIFLASEIVHHVRVCLDYCAYNAVWIAKGQPNDHTKFPLVTAPEKWNKARRSGIQGVKGDHLKWIEAVQPYNGVEWTAELLELSNQDKHRTTVELVPLYKVRFNPKDMYADPAGDPKYRGFQAEHARVEMRIAPAMTTIGDGPPGRNAQTTLFDLLEGVIGLVNNFLAEAGYKQIEVTRGTRSDRSGAWRYGPGRPMRVSDRYLCSIASGDDSKDHAVGTGCLRWAVAQTRTAPQP
ncbi:hypothetical protein [Nesterenkonia sp. NBAIMH1]|uniref:hypothetical protein n=1 Tax=Nesterenkonia sp. NBAIMH1 TaxID=2600320 RepID=UPI0011B6C61F|nr:hypothetical protein [Nesterenkonia sp. NBAIMH1]